jgi:ABC-type transport system involved in multi-copper enzyme maturation permease subunit
MSAVVSAAPAPDVSSLPEPKRPRFVDVLLSEWTKFRTVRSSFLTLAVGAVLGIGLGAIVSIVSANHYATDPEVHFNWNPTDRSLGSLMLTQLAFAILGVLVVTGEYSTGMIRTSLAAVPNRSKMLAAKTAVMTVVMFVASEIVSFAAFFIGQALISGKAPSANLGQPEVLRAVFGNGLYLTSLALVGLALGVILRHAAAGIGTFVAILLVLPSIALALPTSWAKPIERYWPTNAGFRVASTGHGLERFSISGSVMAPWTGFAVMVVFVAALLVIAFLLIERRDA